MSKPEERPEGEGEPKPSGRRAWIPLRRSHWRGIDGRDEAAEWLRANDPEYFSPRGAGPPWKLKRSVPSAP
jgi:hypothetical protein